MMFWLLLLPAVASLSQIVAAASPSAQKALVHGDFHDTVPDAISPGDEGDDGDDDGPPKKWTLDFTSPTPHLFASIPSLLHQWSNTIFPNGHALAAVEVPAYTLLHHGLISPEDPRPEPPSPEWLAFDPEMSYGIMGSSRDSFLLTYQATRPLKALYFDGESAALMGLGQMDTQMLQLFGNVSGPPAGGFPMGLGVEYLRAHGLCAWFEEAGLGGRGWGLEGVVRMNAGFEMIWCDFSSPSLRLVSRLNVTAPLLPEKEDDDDEGEDEDEDEDQDARAAAATMAGEAMVDDDDDINDLALQARGTTTAQQQRPSYYPLPPQPTRTGRDSEPSHPAPPPNWRRDAGREPFLRTQGWGWFDSATWHYGSTRNGPGRGEARARVLPCGVLSYYSPRFANQTLNRARYDRERLNLTDGGLWMGPQGEEGDRARAVKQLARRRRFHHLGDVVPDEAMMMRRDAERAFRRLVGPGGAGADDECSGADWVLMASEIVQRTTNQLTMMDTSLASFPPAGDAHNETAVYDWLFGLRGQSHLFMVGYLEYPSAADDDDDSSSGSATWSTRSALYAETYSRCRYRYTRLLVPGELRALLSPEEEDIRLAVEDVYGTICSVLLTMGFGIEQAWLDLTGHKGASPRGGAAGTVTALIAGRAAAWRDNIAELTAWLGWESEYYGCREMCAWDERCYIPMWPLIARGGMGGGPGGGPGHGRGPGHGGGGGGGGGGGPSPGDGPGGGRPGGRHPAPDDAEDHQPTPPPPDHNGTGPGRPGFEMPPRGPWWMGDDTDLFEPKCVNINHIMGQR